MLRKVKGSFSRVFNITFHNFDTSYGESKINEALIEFDVRDNTRKDLYCELTMSSGWNHGRFCGMTRFGIYISNYKEMSDNKPYNISRVVMLEDTSTQVLGPDYAGLNVTVNPDYFIGDKSKPGRFGIRVLHVAKSSEENDTVNSFSLLAECKLEVFTHECEIENMKITTGWNEFDVNKFGKMFIGDYCDYYPPTTDFLDVKYPNGNIYDDNGFTRYQRSANIDINSNYWQFKLYNNGVYECNGWISCAAGEWTVVKFPIPFVSPNIDIVARPVDRPMNDVAIEISRPAADELRIKVDKACVVSLICNYVWDYNGYEFNRDLYDHIPGTPSRIANAIQRQKKLKLFKGYFSTLRLFEGGEKCA